MNKAAEEYSSRLKSYIDECHFDVGVGSSNPFMIDEAQLAKLLTRIVVSTATIITTSLSLKQFVKEISSNYKRNKI